jgi:hypothetical protein
MKPVHEANSPGPGTTFLDRFYSTLMGMQSQVMEKMVSAFYFYF